MKSGDLLEFKSNSIIGKLIRMKTGKDVNHSSLILKLYGKVFTLESLGSGIELHRLDNRVKDFNGNIYWYPLNSEYNKYRRKISTWALDQIDVKYDYPGVFANLFGKVNLDSRLYFCSEYVQAAYRFVGMIEDGRSCVPGEFGKYDLHGERVKIK